MMRSLLVITSLTMPLLFTACEREGPAERAGAQVDQAVEDLGESVEEAGDKIQEQTN